METRRTFISHMLIGAATTLIALFAVACGKKPEPVPAPDSETAASPEWPPKDE